MKISDVDCRGLSRNLQWLCRYVAVLLSRHSSHRSRAMEQRTMSSGSHQRLAPIAQRTKRLAAHGADRSADTVNFCCRPTPGSWYYRLSSICYRPVTRNHREHGDHFRQSHSPHSDVDCACCQYCRISPATLLPRTLPPSYIGRRMVDHRLHSGDRGHSGCIQGRPCHISQNYRSDPSVPVDRGGVCNTVSFCRPVRSWRYQGNNI